MIIQLPWPPSENSYRRSVGYMQVISKAGREYKRTVKTMIRIKNIPRITSPVEVQVLLSPPDNRRRDLDNTLKAMFDAISDEMIKQKNKPDEIIRGILEDDSQIVKLSMRWLKKSPGGSVVMIIEPTDDERESLESVLETIKDNGIYSFT